MKYLHILALAIGITFTACGQSQKQTETFKVYGNCEHCKARIEEALDVKGVKTASWNPENRQLTVTYNPAVISHSQLKERVATSGHDTDSLKATTQTYNSLPECCRYKREAK